MSAEDQNKNKTALLDTVSLLQAKIKKNALEAPTFENNTHLKTKYSKAINRVLQLSKDERFSSFNSHHQKLASYLINIFYELPLKHLKEAAEFALNKVNVSLVKYALSVALIHRTDAATANINLPSHVTIEPGLYFDMKEITRKVLNNEALQGESEVRKHYVDTTNNFTGTNKDPEHKVAYFREDIGLNLHHLHWHQVYPSAGAADIVKKDRRGELFYYMHEQMLARYNFERLSQGLPLVEAFEDLREPMKEAYFPKMQDMSPNSVFPGRPANCVLKDLNRDNSHVKIAAMEAWRERIFNAITRGYAYVFDHNTKKEVLKIIEEETGIDELVNTVEAVEMLSWNYHYYGNIHNNGHLLIGNVHDPDYRYKENTGIMAFPETTSRDPMFYRWHAFINNIYQRYKETLPPYPVDKRQFEGITIESVNILQENQSYNVLKTFRQNDVVDITEELLGIDPTKGDIYYACFQHLQHENFEYEIKVKSELTADVTGTVRIFMAPHYDEAGLEMTFNDQRKLFIELDRFTAKISPKTTTTIKQKSTDSSVTIPFEQIFLTLNGVKELAKKAGDSYCGCGWPHYLLIGRGTVGEGLLCDLFVMITNYDHDKVEGSPLEQKCCPKSSLAYCGVRDKKYPDKQPMGFPFDRNIHDPESNLQDFMTEGQEYQSGGKSPVLSNMKVVQIRVQHDNNRVSCGPSITDPKLKEKFAHH